jgi:cytochrome c5
MKLPQKSLLAILAVILSACASASTADPAPAPAGGETSMPAAETGSGSDTPVVAEPSPGASSTFSAAQADRGRDMFRATCTECHYSSEFSDSQFKFKWSRRSAGNLYQLILTSMPETEPGILTPEETVDLVSYILRMNGFEPGVGELAAERAVLDGVSLASIRNQ